MFRKLLATTAIAAIMTAGAMAQDQKPATDGSNNPLFSDRQEGMMQSETGFFEANASQILASDLLGMTLYNGPGDDAEAVGDINDVIMGPDGNAEAVVVGVGGFLGIGEKEVAVDFSRISWIDRDNARWLIIDSTKEELEGAPAFDRTAFEPTTEEETVASDNTTDTMATDPAMQEGQETAATEQQPAATEGTNQTAQAENEQVDASETAAIDPNSWTPVTTDQLSADELLGTRVYGANDEDIGEIGDVIVTADGKFEAYVVDVGGFLGMGEKPVALGASELQILKDADGEFHIRTSFTQEQLEAQAAYDAEVYKSNPEGIILQ
jgi:sporulation protein YlmC with PRC-barrel domain